MSNLADFETTGSYDYNTNIISFNFNNIGTVDATGYGNKDWHRIFEVTTDINEAVKLDQIPANTPFIFIQDGVTHTYYQKSPNVDNIQISVNSSYNSIHNTSYTMTSPGSKYITSTPPLKAGDSLFFKLTGNFENGKTYLITADDSLYSLTGDTVELIDNNDNPSNNNFVFTYGPPGPPPPAPICFPAGTPVLTNLGEVAIEKLNPAKHTIRGNQIVAITQSRPLQKYIVCFEKDSLSKNVPSQQTLCSMEHKVFYKGEMTKARNIVDLCENVTFVDYNGETLYNVLLKKSEKMMINNLICETLSPESMIAKITQIKDVQQKRKVMSKLTKIITEGNVEEYKKLGASLNEPKVKKSRRLL